ncbi:MAG: hypothetical protein LBL66_00390, partial [Clostridiales bacterium]|nr:hypothetical protein [Clostridiales bacterium]
INSRYLPKTLVLKSIYQLPLYQVISSILQQVYCEEREARRGKIYQTRNAPFYIEIAGRTLFAPPTPRIVANFLKMCYNGNNPKKNGGFLKNESLIRLLRTDEHD